MRTIIAHSATTGEILWYSEPGTYPWFNMLAYDHTLAYGMNYIAAYDGVYARNDTNGKIVWHFNYTGAGYETPYQDNWPFYWGTCCADGKIYHVSGVYMESPLFRGSKLFCIDAYTGKQMWNISFAQVLRTRPNPIVAEGLLISKNDYDECIYCFGKGKTATTVTAPDVAITQGQSVVIKGTVLDQSPAQAGTTCVNKDSMAVQMDYLHMQKPIDGIYHNLTITGVPVSLDTVDPDGKSVHIGDVTTDGYSGTFGFTWKPEVPGQYTVTATFMGDESYGSSFAKTCVGVLEAPAAISEKTQVVVDNTGLLYGIMAGVIAAIIIGIVAILLVLRKR